MELSMLPLKRLLLAASMSSLVATANAAPMDDAKAANDRGDYSQALKIFRSLAAQGNASAQYNIGLMYYNGRGGTRNYQEALKWYRLAAAQEFAEAQYVIGWMYEQGEGVAQNYQEALKWYRLAAAQFDGAAIAKLEYVSSRIKALDYAQNLTLATQGNVSAQSTLGFIYRTGMGVPQDYHEALKWYRLAAAQKDASAIANLRLPEMVEAALNYRANQKQEASAPDRRSTSIKTATQQAEQVSIETNRKTEQPRRTATRNETPERTSLPKSVFNASTPQSDVSTQQEEQVSIKTTRKTDQPRRAATRTETPERTSPPKLVFNSSTPKSDGTVELSGRVISDASISEISINGRALEVSLGRDNSFKVTRLPPMGVVTSYRLSVSDEYGQKVEKEINVERAAIQYAEQVAPLNPRKLKAQTNPNAVALIIGIEAYSRLPQAQYADSDATHFYDYANQSLGVPPHKIKLLTDTKANRVDLLQAMRSWMKTEVNGKSDVYIFFAGHGLASADGSKTYLLPADGDRDLLDETSILRDDLIASAKGAKTITMFLDTCYSGGTRTNEILLADARPIAIVPDMKALPSNVTVLAAASGAQLSSTYEAAQQGLFSYWLMKGLEGDADTNKDKKITTGELHEYVVKQVGPMAQRRNRQQDPQLMGDSTRVLVSY